MRLRLIRDKIMRDRLNSSKSGRTCDLVPTSLEELRVSAKELTADRKWKRKRCPALLERLAPTKIDLLLTIRDLSQFQIIENQKSYRPWPAFNNVSRGPRIRCLVQWEVAKETSQAVQVLECNSHLLAGHLKSRNPLQNSRHKITSPVGTSSTTMIK